MGVLNEKRCKCNDNYTLIDGECMLETPTEPPQ